jgi:hypothetical protein
MPFTPEVVEQKADTSGQSIKAEESQISRAELFHQVMEHRKGMKPVTTQEILDWTREGRP